MDFRVESKYFDQLGVLLNYDADFSLHLGPMDVVLWECACLLKLTPAHHPQTNKTTTEQRACQTRCLHFGGS